MPLSLAALPAEFPIARGRKDCPPAKKTTIRTLPSSSSARCQPAVNTRKKSRCNKSLASSRPNEICRNGGQPSALRHGDRLEAEAAMSLSEYCRRSALECRRAATAVDVRLKEELAAPGRFLVLSC